MTASKGLSQLFRTLAIIFAIGVLTSSITYAALQSPAAILVNNNINIGGADLRIGLNGTAFSVPSAVGFTFDGVVPGGAEQPLAGNTVYLKNFSSNISLALYAAVNSTPANLSGVNLSKVYFDFTRVDDNSTELKIPLKSLMDANTTGGVSLNELLAPGNSAQFSLKASMDSDAYSGSGAGVSISGINIAFTGIGS